jgi:hypothetical protein
LFWRLYLVGPWYREICLPEPPSVDGQQDRMQQPHWNKTKRNSVDEECDIAAQRG